MINFLFSSKLTEIISNSAFKPIPRCLLMQKSPVPVELR